MEGTSFTPKEEVTQSGQGEPEIMSFEELVSEERSYPYIFELEDGDKSLLYYGSRHSRNPEDPMFEEIKEKYQDFKPEMVFIEGWNNLESQRTKVMQELLRTDVKTIINKYGEPGFVLRLAAENGIEVECPEPDYSEEIQYLTNQGFTKEELFAHYIYRVVPQWCAMAEKPTIEEYLDPYIEEFKRASQWPDFEYTINNLKQIGETFWGKWFVIDQAIPSRITPIPTNAPEIPWTRVNEVAKESGLFRDRFIVKRIDDAMKRTSRLMVVYGGSHAHLQEPALRKLFKAA